MKLLFATAASCLLLVTSPLGAQTFSSGSTGADGALNLATACSSPFVADPDSCYVQLPPNGVLNYTTINVPNGKTLKFQRNLNNTPVIMLAQGTVTISGSIDITGGDYEPPSYGLNKMAPGPGGFRGGPPGQPGFGPGGGVGGSVFGNTTEGSSQGKWIGPLSLVPIVGGGGGGGVIYAFGANNGCGGGGAIVVASSGTVQVTGTILAYGASEHSFTNTVCATGAGGAIRLVANSVVVSGHLDAMGGSSTGVNTFGQGLIRIEAPLGAVTLSGSSAPAAIIAPINPAIFPSSIPSLTIVSVGGQAVPSYSGQRFDTVDLLLPMQLPDPIDVVVAANNIPTGTSVGISFGTTNAGTVTTGTLSGSFGSSTATARVSGLNRAQLAYLWVHTTFGVPQSADAGNPPGPNQVAQVQASAPPAGATQFVFLRRDGTRVDDGDVPPQILKQFRQ